MKLGKIRKALEGLLLDVNLGRVTTDKAIITWDSDEDLKSGDFVRGVNEEGNEYDLEDGDYVTDDGKTIVVEGNKVVEIKDKEAEVAPTNEEFARMTIQNFEVSYTEKEQLIAEAYTNMGGLGYLAEAGDEYAVFYLYNGDWEPAGYMRYDIEWVDGKPVLSNPVEVKPAYAVKDVEKTDVEKTDVEEEKKEEEVKEEKKEEMSKLQEQDNESPVEPDEDKKSTEPEPDEKEDTEDSAEDRIAKLEELVSKLENRIAKLEENPKTVEEEFRGLNKPKGNGRKENNIIRFAEA